MEKNVFTVADLRKAVEILKKNSIPKVALGAKCDENGYLTGGFINIWDYPPRILTKEDLL